MIALLVVALLVVAAAVGALTYYGHAMIEEVREKTVDNRNDIGTEAVQRKGSLKTMADDVNTITANMSAQYKKLAASNADRVGDVERRVSDADASLSSMFRQDSLGIFEPPGSVTPDLEALRRLVATMGLTVDDSLDLCPGGSSGGPGCSALSSTASGLVVRPPAGGALSVESDLRVREASLVSALTTTGRVLHINADVTGGAGGGGAAAAGPDVTIHSGHVLESRVPVRVPDMSSEVRTGLPSGSLYMVGGALTVKTADGEARLAVAGDGAGDGAGAIP